MLDGTTSYLDTTDDHLVEPWPSVKVCNGADWLGLQHFVLKKGKCKSRHCSWTRRRLRPHLELKSNEPMSQQVFPLSFAGGNTCSRIKDSSPKWQVDDSTLKERRPFAGVRSPRFSFFFFGCVWSSSSEEATCHFLTLLRRSLCFDRPRPRCCSSSAASTAPH